jgi:hypothetical protein
MKKILISLSALAMFAAFSGVARAGEEGAAPAKAEKTTKKSTKKSDKAAGEGTTETKTEKTTETKK